MHISLSQALLLLTFLLVLHWHASSTGSAGTSYPRPGMDATGYGSPMGETLSQSAVDAFVFVFASPVTLKACTESRNSASISG